MQGNLIAICLEQLADPHPLLRQWLALCLGRIWTNYDRAKWCGVRDSAHEKLYSLSTDPLPEVDFHNVCMFYVFEELLKVLHDLTQFRFYAMFVYILQGFTFADRSGQLLLFYSSGTFCFADTHLNGYKIILRQKLGQKLHE